jgi:bifunctional non-homologous end joining protein LigD
VIDYYARIADAIVPHLSGRALTVTRWPDGVEGKHFFEKRSPRHRPEWVRTESIWAGKRAGEIEFAVCDDRPTLVWLAQLAALELHPSLALADDVQRPTVLAFDLDPGPPATIVECCRVALTLRKLFSSFGLELFPKTSGSKGMQVYLPLNDDGVTYEETKPFARALAQALEKSEPDLVVSKMKKELRGGKVFVDWSQNDVSKTTIAVYSLRAKSRPTASTPLHWDEVEECAEKGDANLLVFEAEQVLKRVAEHGDLFAPVLELEQELPDGLGEDPG